MFTSEIYKRVNLDKKLTRLNVKIPIVVFTVYQKDI